MKKLMVALALSASLVVAHADDGIDWRKASKDSRHAEITRILNNIKAKGCYVKYTPEYYVRQLNDFYAEKATRSIEVHKALALIATGAGEVWC